MIEPIVRKTVNTCTNATVQDVVLDRWPNDVHIQWNNISGIDETSAATCVQVGLKRASVFFPLRGAALGAAHRSVRLFARTIVTGDYQPCARFYGATLGDELMVCASGVIIRGMRDGDTPPYAVL